MKNILFTLTCILLIVSSCRKTDKQISELRTSVSVDSVFGTVVADTIIYDVIIRNPNPDDTWAAHCLQGLDHALLIDTIFDLIYSGKAEAYDHETNEKLTPKQVKKIEKEEDFQRDNIGMIQFTEVWYLNAEQVTMTKKVTGMVLGYTRYTNNGELMGYKALFRIKLD